MRKSALRGKQEVDDVEVGSSGSGAGSLSVDLTKHGLAIILPNISFHSCEMGLKTPSELLRRSDETMHVQGTALVLAQSQCSRDEDLLLIWGIFSFCSGLNSPQKAETPMRGLSGTCMWKDCV